MSSIPNYNWYNTILPSPIKWWKCIECNHFYRADWFYMCRHDQLCEYCFNNKFYEKYGRLPLSIKIV